MAHDDPMIVSEHRDSFSNTEELEDIVHPEAVVTLYAISATRFAAKKAAEQLATEGILCNVVHIVWLKPFTADERLVLPLLHSKHGIVIDAGYETAGASQAIAYQLTQKTGIPVKALGLEDCTKCLCPPLKNEIPTPDKIAGLVRSMLTVGSIRSDYRDGIVTKPWGYEYLMYQSDKIGIWFLHINEGRSTSLHCHPAKKTGYILLSGEAEVSFIRDTTRLKAVSKLMIREGLFHATKAISPGGIQVIEVESPPNKTNLVRLEDAYGRENLPYEGLDAVVPSNGDCIFLQPPEPCHPAVYTVSGTQLVIEHLDNPDMLKERPAGEIILILDGGLVSKNGDPVLSAGDVITISTFTRLAGSFTAPQGMSFMSIRQGGM